jgi:hypothetical protein
MIDGSKVAQDQGGSFAVELKDCFVVELSLVLRKFL